jgi:hypothetical protein
VRFFVGKKIPLHFFLKALSSWFDIFHRIAEDGQILESIKPSVSGEA